MSIEIREPKVSECSHLLHLMQQLADFEGYRDKFCVTEHDLLTRYFNHREFEILVAEHQGELVGLLVYYFLPFSYDLTPWMFIKELFVDKQCRGLHIGSLLMRRAAKVCHDQGGSQIRWAVLTDNLPAQTFYRSLGAQPDVEWQNFQLSGDALVKLATTE